MRKRLLYVPGVISLVCLPLLLYFFHPKYEYQPTALKINLPSDEPSKGGSFRFNREFVYKKINKKKIEQIQFDNQFPINKSDFRYYNDLKRKFINDEMKRLQLTNDTSTVLKVEFFDENTYGDFVYVLNLAQIYVYKRYAFIDNCFYFFPNDPIVITKNDTISLLSIDTTIRYIGTSPNHEKYYRPTEWDFFIWDLEYRLSLYKLNSFQRNSFISAFILLIVIPAFYKIRKNRKLIS